MPDEKNMPSMPHNLVLEDRRLLTVSGVSDVDSFDGARQGSAYQSPER